MKRTCALLIAFTLLLSLTFGAFSAPAVSSVTVSLGARYGNVEYSQVYTAPNQINMLLACIPPESSRLPKGYVAPPSEGLAVDLKFTRNGVRERWSFYENRCERSDNTGAEIWLASSHETWELLLQLSGLDPIGRAFATPEPLYYKGERVTALYSLEGRYCSYQPISVPNIQKLLPLLEKQPPNTSTGKAAPSLGFLLFTEKDKYTWSYSYDNVYGVRPLGEDGTAQRAAWVKAVKDTTALNMLSALYNEAPWGRKAQWLAYMSEEKIESISFSGLGGSGYSNSYHPEARKFSVGVNTQDRESIHKIASFLKTMEVFPAPKVHAGPDNPLTVTGLIDMRIKFNTGTTYTIFGYDESISIHTSDLDGTVIYDVSKRQMDALRDFMALLPEASLHTAAF